MYDWLILLILDAVILIGLVLFFSENRLRQAPRAALIGLALALTWAVCVPLCRWLSGWLIGSLAAVPLAILSGAVLKVYGRLPWKRAALAAVVFLGAWVLLGTLAWLF